MPTPSKTDFRLGLVGHGISQSLTPAMQRREGAAAGLTVSYDIIDAATGGFGSDDIADLLRWARRFGFDGLNITHPFKQVVLPLLDGVSEDAADLGAVNTVVFRDGRATGHNTDWSGWGRAFRRALPEATADRAVLVGAGGAGAAVGYALLDQGAEHVTVIDVDAEKAADCVVRLAKRYGDDRVSASTDLSAALEGAGGLVNATPIGMVGHEGLPVPVELLRPELWVSDVVYRPLETELVRVARERGCRVVPGGGMAVFQAVGAFELFTERAADPERMLAHFEELTR